MTSDTTGQQGLVPLDEYDDLLSRMTEMESQRNHYRSRDEWASDLLRRAASENEALKAELAETRRVAAEAVAAIRARIEAPDATVLSWDYILACALDDEPVNDIVSEPVDRWVTRALRALVATTNTEERT
jgi:uncharacterized Rossmann fold enzyme